MNNATQTSQLKNGINISRADLILKFWEKRLCAESNYIGGKYISYSPQTIRGVVVCPDGIFLIKHISDDGGNCEYASYAQMLKVVNEGREKEYIIDVNSPVSAFEFCGISFDENGNLKKSNSRVFKAIEEFSLIAGIPENSKAMNTVWLNADKTFLANIVRGCTEAKKKGETSLAGLNRLYGCSYIGYERIFTSVERNNVQQAIKADAKKSIHYRHFYDYIAHGGEKDPEEANHDYLFYLKKENRSTTFDSVPKVGNYAARDYEVILKPCFTETWARFNWGKDSRNGGADTTILNSDWYVQDALPSDENPDGGELFASFKKIHDERYLKIQAANNAKNEKEVVFESIMQAMINDKAPLHVSYLWFYNMFYAVTHIKQSLSFIEMIENTTDVNIMGAGRRLKGYFNGLGFELFFQEMNTGIGSKLLWRKFKSYLKTSETNKNCLPVKNYKKYMEYTDSDLEKLFTPSRYSTLAHELWDYMKEGADIKLGTVEKEWQFTEGFLRFLVDISCGLDIYTPCIRSSGISCHLFTETEYKYTGDVSRESVIHKFYDEVILHNTIPDTAFKYCCFLPKTSLCSSMLSSELCKFDKVIASLNVTDVLTDGGVAFYARPERDRYVKLRRVADNSKFSDNQVTDVNDFVAYLYYIAALNDTLVELAYTYVSILYTFCMVLYKDKEILDLKPNAYKESLESMFTSDYVFILDKSIIRRVVNEPGILKMFEEDVSKYVDQYMTQNNIWGMPAGTVKEVLDMKCDAHKYHKGKIDYTSILADSCDALSFAMRYVMFSVIRKG